MWTFQRNETVLIGISKVLTGQSVRRTVFVGLLHENNKCLRSRSRPRCLNVLSQDISQSFTLCSLLHFLHHSQSFTLSLSLTHLPKNTRTRSIYAFFCFLSLSCSSNSEVIFLGQSANSRFFSRLFGTYSGLRFIAHLLSPFITAKHEKLVGTVIRFFKVVKLCVKVFCKRPLPNGSVVAPCAKSASLTT